MSNYKVFIKIKHYLVIALIIILIPLFFSCVKQITLDGVTYYKKGNEIFVYKLTDKNTTNVVIPITIEDVQVTTVSRFAFAHQSNLVSVILPGGLIEIEDSAFVGCDNLTYVILPYSIVKMGKDVFKLNPNLQIYYTNFYTSLPTGWDESYKDEQTIVYSKDQWSYFEGLPVLKDNQVIVKTYFNDELITNIRLELNDYVEQDQINKAKKYYLRELANNPDYQDYELVEVRVTSYTTSGVLVKRMFPIIELKSVLNTPFYFAASPFEFELIGTSYQLTKVKDTELDSTSLVVPNFINKKLVTSIAPYALSNLPLLETLTLPLGLITLSNHAITNNPSLEKLTLSPYITTLEDYSLSNNTGLKELTINKCLEYISPLALEDSRQLEGFIVDANNPIYKHQPYALYNPTSSSGALLSKDGISLYILPFYQKELEGDEKDYIFLLHKELPTVNIIKSYALNQINLKSIIIETAGDHYKFNIEAQGIYYCLDLIIYFLDSTNREQTWPINFAYAYKALFYQTQWNVDTVEPATNFNYYIFIVPKEISLTPRDLYGNGTVAKNYNWVDDPDYPDIYYQFPDVSWPGIETQEDEFGNKIVIAVPKDETLDYSI